MVFKPKSAAERRTVIYKIRVRPEFKNVIDEMVEMCAELRPKDELTATDLIREAMEKFFLQDDDPRRA